MLLFFQISSCGSRKSILIYVNIYYVFALDIILFFSTILLVEAASRISIFYFVIYFCSCFCIHVFGFFSIFRLAAAASRISIFLI